MERIVNPETDKSLEDLLKAKAEGRVLILPCKPGDTVYRVVDKCRPRFQDCPYSGGYGWSRCPKAGESDERCHAYIEETKFTACVMKIGETVYITKEEAEKRRDKLNEKH